ncbi:MAG: hypothetical protein QM758_20960 [Armatimonas sp.]
MLLSSGGFLWARNSGVLGAFRVGTSGGGVLSARQTTPSDDVVAYLRWLKSFEADRHRIQVNHSLSLAPLFTTAGYADMLSEDAPPIIGPPELAVARRFEERVSPVVRGSAATQAAFEQMPSTAECAALAMNYHGALGHARTGLGTIFEKTITTIHGMARSTDKLKEATPTLTYLNREQQEKNLSHAVDATFANAEKELLALQSQYLLPTDIDSAHFTISPG